MKFEDQITTKKGNLGEEELDKYLEANGFVVYHPKTGKAHPFDRLCASADKKKIFIAECKTKPARLYYPDTGINLSHYDDYLNVRNHYNIDIWIFFVDEYKKMIYGNPLEKLETPRRIFHNGKELEYPLVDRGIIYFPLFAMEVVARLDEKTSLKLQQLSSRNYSYESEEVPF